MQCLIRKTWIFADGTFKFARLIRNLAEFTDRTTFPHPMNDLFPTRADGRSLRKTFGRQVYNMNSENSELALVKLMELFNHSSVAITKRYLGLRQEEILETYDCLTFRFFCKGNIIHSHLFVKFVAIPSQQWQGRTF